MKIVIDIQDEDVLFDISKHNLSPTSQTDSVIINALYDGKPIEDDRPTLIYKGQVVYLTDEHIQAMAEWEKEEMKKEVLEQFKKTIDGLSDFDFDWQSEMRKDYSDVIAQASVGLQLFQVFQIPSQILDGLRHHVGKAQVVEVVFEGATKQELHAHVENLFALFGTDFVFEIHAFVR